MAGTKKDQGKPEVAIIPPIAILEEAKAFTYGKKKYGKWNFKKGLEVTRLISAAMRHILQFLGGEDIDKESEAHHLGCARANLAMALDMMERKPELDDRYRK
jgi:hypothetical protein